MRRVFCLLTGIIFSVNLYAQDAIDTTPPFRRFPVIPPVKLLAIDSMSVITKDNLTKNKPVLLILFSPECEHCQHETEAILARINELKKVQIIMATTLPFDMMKEFYEKYRLADYKNIRVGQDTQYLLPSFYRVHSLPYLAMYDKKGKLIRTFEGTMNIEDLINVFK